MERSLGSQLKTKMMKRRNLKFLFGMFFVIFLVGIVSAGCCVDKEAGYSRDVASESDCNSDDYHEAFACSELSDEAKNPYPRGCCVDHNNYVCGENSLENDCQREGLEWSGEEQCGSLSKSPNVCLEGCCVVDGIGHFGTRMYCSSISKESMDFRPGVTEAGCKDVYSSSEKGACVDSNGGCKYVSAESCGDSDTFYSGIYCSDSSLKSKEVFCNAQQRKDCFEGDIYWYDSCNNPENVVEEC